VVQGIKNTYPSRPGTALQETREAAKFKSSDKVASIVSLKKEARNSILGAKK